MNFKNLVFIFFVLFISSCTTSKYLAPVVNKNTSSESIKTASKIIKIYSGDSLYSISKREGVSIRSIIEVNNLKPPFILYEGEELIIAISKIHIVKAGNTLWDIAKCYRVSVIDIRRLNKLKFKDKIYEDKKLLIPINNENNNLECNNISKVAIKYNNKEKKVRNKDKIINNNSNSNYL